MAAAVGTFGGAIADACPCPAVPAKPLAATLSATRAANPATKSIARCFIASTSFLPCVRSGLDREPSVYGAVVSSRVLGKSDLVLTRSQPLTHAKGSDLDESRSLDGADV